MCIYRVSCPKPDGAFYLLPDVSAYYGKSAANGKKITNPDGLCLELLREQQVHYIYIYIYTYTYIRVHMMYMMYMMYVMNVCMYVCMKDLLTTFLLHPFQVALVSGDAFGASSCIRLSYAASKELIEQSISRLKTFLMSLS